MSGGGRLTVSQRWVLGLASLASFMISLDSLVVTTALGAIHTSLEASLSSLEWTVNAYNLAFAALLLTGSALGDRFGRKRMFIVGLALFTVASVACALSPNVALLVAARALQGCGAAAVMPLALTQLSSAVPPQQRGKALGIFSGVTGLATFLGPLVGGSVTQGLAWQWIFWLNLPVGAVAIVLVQLRITESTGPDARLDLGGVILVTGGALGLVWGLIRANAVGWRTAEVLAALIAGGVLLAAFVVYESRTRSPMLPMRFFRVRAFTAANLANFCLFTSLYGTLFLTSLYLQNGLGYGPLGAGLRLLPWTGTLMVLAPPAGALADRLGERRLVVAGLLVEAISLALLSRVSGAHLHQLGMVLLLVAAGCGISMAMPSAQRAVVGAVQVSDVGRASGAFSMLRILGGVFGIAILTAVFTSRGGELASPGAFRPGYPPAVAAAAIVALAGALAGLGLTRRTRPGATQKARTPVPVRHDDLDRGPLAGPIPAEPGD